MNTSSFSLSEVLAWTGGRLANESAFVHSPAEVRVSQLSGLGSSREQDIAFFFSTAYQDEIPHARAGILVTGEAFVQPLEKSGLPIWKNSAIIACRDPYLAMARVSARVAEKQSTVAHLEKMGTQSAASVHPTAILGSGVKLGPGVRVGAYCVIEDGTEIGDGTVLYPHCVIGPGCRVGRDCVFFAHVVVYEWAQIGNRVRLHSGVVIGADGFGYAPRFEDGRIVAHEKIYHLGRVVIEDEVELGAGAKVDRGTVSDTRIGRGAKIDNNVQVGHNCQVGEGAIICGMAAMAGSSEIGKFVYLAGLTGVGNKVSIGDGARVGGGGLVTKDIPPGAEVVGFPQRSPKDFYRIHVLLNQMLEQKKKSKKGE